MHEDSSDHFFDLQESFLEKEGIKHILRKENIKRDQKTFKDQQTLNIIIEMIKSINKINSGINYFDLSQEDFISHIIAGLHHVAKLEGKIIEPFMVTYIVPLFKSILTSTCLSNEIICRTLTIIIYLFDFNYFPILDQLIDDSLNYIFNNDQILQSKALSLLTILYLSSKISFEIIEKQQILEKYFLLLKDSKTNNSNETIFDPHLSHSIIQLCKSLFLTQSFETSSFSKSQIIPLLLSAIPHFLFDTNTEICIDTFKLLIVLSSKPEFISIYMNPTQYFSYIFSSYSCFLEPSTIVPFFSLLVSCSKSNIDIEFDSKDELVLKYIFSPHIPEKLSVCLVNELPLPISTEQMIKILTHTLVLPFRAFRKSLFIISKILRYSENLFSIFQYIYQIIEKALESDDIHLIEPVICILQSCLNYSTIPFDSLHNLVNNVSSFQNNEEVGSIVSQFIETLPRDFYPN